MGDINKKNNKDKFREKRVYVRRGSEMLKGSESGIFIYNICKHILRNVRQSV